MLLIKTSTGDRLFNFINIEDDERSRTPKIRGFREFFVISGCDTHFKSELRRNG